MKRKQQRTKAAANLSVKAAFMGAMPVIAALALAPAAYAQTQAYDFSIESQPLSSALLSLGRQAGLSVLAPTTLIEGKTAPPVRGELSVSAALDQLLAGSGLSYIFVRSDAVKIVAKDRAELTPQRTQTPERDDAGDRVIVTGTNIRGVGPAASPVDVYTREDITRSGAVTTEQFVAKIPQNQGSFSQFAVGSSTAGPNFDAVTTVDLRGLGVGTTLTLLNGHRMALSNGGRSADVSLIPASAIERVEVLTDGASAVYGSDAVGGVVNFILRDDFEGAETRLSYGGVSRGGLRQADASQTFGARWEGGHGLAAYGFHAASALTTSDRSYAAPAGPGNLTPVDTRHNLFLTATQKIGEQLTVGVDLGAGWRKVKNDYSNLSSPSPASQTFTRYKSTTDQLFGTLDVDYEISRDLTANVVASYAETDIDGLATLTRFRLTPPVSARRDYSAKNSQLDIMGKLDGTLTSLPAGDVRFSVGGGVLEEDYRGVSPLTSAQSLGTLGRRSSYGFGELFVPLISANQAIPFVHDLSLSLAARYTDYQETSAPSTNRDFGDSTDPKIGVLWSPTESLSFRSTYGSSFRAPSLTQLDQGGGGLFLLPDVVAGASAIVLTMAGYAAPDLGPETADTFTLGFDYRSNGPSDFRFGATYYNTDYTNRIGTAPTGGLNPFATPDLVPDLIYRPPSQAFLEDVLRATPSLLNFSSVDTTDPAAGAAALFARNDVWVFDARYKNLAVSQQDGIDFSASYGFDTVWGDVEVSGNATHILNYRQRGSASSLTFDAVDIPGQPADWRGRASATLSNNPFSATLSVNYTDDYANGLAPAGRQRIDSWMTVDAYLAYDFTGESASRGPRLALSIQNLLDEDPPFLGTDPGSSILYPIGFDPANANPLGRLVVLSLTQTW